MDEHILLALDSSGHSCSVAVSKGKTILAEFTLDIGKTHSRSLVKLCEQAMEAAEVDFPDLTALVCVNGPGSYTGIRIGLPL